MEKTYKITGMHCAACSVGLEKFMSAQPGVNAVQVNIATERMRIDFDESVLPEADIPDRVAKLSFGAEDYVPPEAMAAEERRRLAAEAERAWKRRKRRVIACCCLAAPLIYICLSHLWARGLSLPGFMDCAAHPLVYGLVQLALTVPVLWMGRDFYTGGLPSLLRGQPNMDSLVALGTGSAFLYAVFSLCMIAAGHTEYTDGLFFDSAATVVTLVMLGKTLEARSKDRTGDAIRRLRELTPETATVTRFGTTARIPAAELRPGDIVTVGAGEHFPCDGVVTEGESEADASMLTGESEPVALLPGSEVTGGCVNGDGVIVMTASGVGADSRLAGIVRLVEEAQGRKAPIARAADRVAGVFVPTVLGIAALAAVIWALAGKDAAFVLNIFISVLVIACPCSLGLATPTALLCGTGRAAELGILFRSGEALQALASIDSVALDKTGTLTLGRPEVVALRCAEGADETELISVTAGAEVHSSHPSAGAIRRYAEARGIAPAAITDLQNHPGRGVTGRRGEKNILVGNATLLREAGLPLPETDAGGSVIYCAAGGRLLGRFETRDILRPDSRDAVVALTADGIRCVMLTGDSAAAAQLAAREAGITELRAEILPEDKAAAVESLQAEGRKLAMVGDGINDAPALAAAEVGIAVGSGTDVALESADVVLTGDSLAAVDTAVRLSRAVMRNIRQNLFWAFGYNTLGIPIAAGVLYAFGGPLLKPMFAGAAMAMSSICVVSNALRLKRWRDK